MDRDNNKLLLTFISAAMQISWIFALLSLVNVKASGGRFPVWTVLAAFPAGFIVYRIVGSLKTKFLIRESVFWALWLAGFLIFVKMLIYPQYGLWEGLWLGAFLRALLKIFTRFNIELLVLLGSGASWWLGRRLSTAKKDFRMLLGDFQLGVTVLIFTLLISDWMKTSLDCMIPACLSFFVFSLFGLSLAHFSGRTSWARGLSRVQWLGLMITKILIVLGLGVLFVWLVRPDILLFIWECIVRAGIFIGKIIRAVILFLMNLIPAPESKEWLIEPPPPRMPEEGLAKYLRLSESFREIARIGVGIIWAVVILMALYRICYQMFAWIFQKMSGLDEMETESLRGAFMADIKELLRTILRFFTRLAAIVFRIGRFKEKEPGPTASARKLYRRLLRWGQAKGMPKPSFFTPMEYSALLSDAAPNGREDFAFITNQYSKARYGPTTPDKDDLDRMNLSLSRVRRIKRIKKVRQQEK